MQGFELGALIGSAIGAELITRDDLRGNGQLTLPDEPAGRRPGVVANAATAVRDSMGSATFADDVLDNAASRGRWAGEGMVSTLTVELPGPDLTQAQALPRNCACRGDHDAGRRDLPDAGSPR